MDLNRQRIDDRYNDFARRFGDLRAVCFPYSVRNIEQRNEVYDFYTRKLIKRYLRPQKNDMILDFGCGWGRLTFYLSNLVKHIEAIDRAEEMIRLAEKRSLDFPYPNFHFTNSKQDTLPFANHSFDKIFTCFVMQQLNKEELSRTLREFFRVTKEYGRIVLLEHTRPEEKVYEEVVIHRSAHYYQEAGRQAGFRLTNSSVVLRSPSYSMGLREKYFPFSKIIGLSGYLRLEQWTVNRKPHFADYYAHAFVFEKPATRGTLS